ncbi:hypothetical protein [Candidatus Nitrosacidococcus tergens]|uniref:Uncharacterized protein n=1 Tax=Candidatus Nitrosacidococcus tergens TaxID=553981 RepID=A0A7G1Q7P8_9GAMM|nr:hypothetical protein [Candidatus Nitrosacidococcus tergens]CAB1274666.1 exported protein of unknown function [Candidatus Nitrosacidococcus tergens]
MNKARFFINIFLLCFSIYVQAASSLSPFAPENGFYIANQPTNAFRGINIEVQNNTIFVSKFYIDGTWTSGSSLFQQGTATVQMVKTNPDNTTIPEETDTYTVDSDGNLSINNIGIQRLNFKYGTDNLNLLIGTWSVASSSPPPNLFNNSGFIILSQEYSDPNTNTPMIMGGDINKSNIIGFASAPSLSLGNNTYIGVSGSGSTSRFFIAKLYGLNHMVGFVSPEGAPIVFISADNFLSSASFFVANRMYDIGSNLSNELGFTTLVNNIFTSTPHSQLSVLMAQINALSSQIQAAIPNGQFSALLSKLSNGQ